MGARLLADYDQHECCPHPFLRSEDAAGGRTAPTRDQCDCACHERSIPRALVLQRVQASRHYEDVLEAALRVTLDRLELAARWLDAEAHRQTEELARRQSGYGLREGAIGLREFIATTTRDVLRNGGGA